MTVNEDMVVSPAIGRKIFKNVGFLLMGRFGGDAFTFVLFVVLARTYGQEGIGQYSFAMALAGFFITFSEFGLYDLSVKEMSRRVGPLGEYYGEIFSLRLILSVAVFGALLIVIPFLPFSSDTKIIIAIIGAYRVFTVLVDGFTAVFVAREEMHVAAFLDFSLRTVTAIGGIAIVMAGGSLAMAVASLPAVGFVQVLVAYGMVKKKHGRLSLAASSSLMAGKLREAIPYAISGLLTQLSSRVDIIFLTFLLGTAAAGIYNAAYRVVFVLMLLPEYASVAIFPLASRLYVNSKEELGLFYHQSLNISILLGLPAAAGLWLIAPNLIGLIFGEAFVESASLLRFLAGLLFLACLKTIMVIFLISSDQQRAVARSEWTGAWVNVLGNILLIPTFGIKGAAIATLISETIMLIIFAMRLKALFGWPSVASRLAMSGVATAAFCLPFLFFPSAPLGLVIPSSVLVYSGTLGLFKDIRRHEVRTFLNMCKAGSGGLLSTGQEIP